MQSVTVDIVPHGNIPTLHVSQNDVGRTLRVNITENEHPRIIIILFGEHPFYLDVKPPKSEAFRMRVDFTSGKSYVTFEVTEEMTAHAGKILCKLREITTYKSVGYGNFIIEVEKAP